MSEHLVCLSDLEARAAAEGRLRLIVRPAVPPAPFDVGDDITVEWATGSIKSPLGAPGDVLLCKETIWYPTCMNCGTLKYVADHPGRPGYMYERVPAPRVPRNLIRHRLPVAEAGVMRAGDMTEDQFRDTGIVPVMEDSGGTDMAGQWIEIPHYEPAYAAEFTRRWGRKVRFEDNPWLWWTRVGEGG